MLGLVPVSERMILLGGGSHPRVGVHAIYHEVQRVILIGIAELIARRNRFLKLAEAN